MQGLNSTRAKHLIEDADLRQQLAGDFLETAGQLSHISQCNLQVVAKIRELVDFEARDNRLDNHRVARSINLVDDLVLAVQVNGAAHEDERSVESILVASVRRQSQVLVASGNNTMINALLLSIVVDAHVADNAKAQLRHHREPVLKFLAYLVISDETVELLDGITVEKGTNTGITERDIDKGFEEIDKVLSLFVLDLFRVRVLNERKDHDLRHRSLNKALATILIDGDALKGPSGSFTHAEVFILQQLLQALEHVINEHLSSDTAQSETAFEESGLFANFRVLVFQKVSSDLKNTLFDHHISSFLNDIKAHWLSGLFKELTWWWTCSLSVFKASLVLSGSSSSLTKTSLNLGIILSKTAVVIYIHTKTMVKLILALTYLTRVDIAT